MKYLLLFVLSACSTSKYYGDITVKQKEYEEIYFITMKADWEHYNHARVSYLYRSEVCEKQKAYPFLIRYQSPEDAGPGKLKFVFSCTGASKEGIQEHHTRVKELCLKDIDLPEINRAYCEHRKRHFDVLPVLPP